MANAGVQTIIEMLGAGTLSETLTIQQMRANFNELTAAAPPPEGARLEAIDAGGVPAEWVRPDETRPDHVVLYLHGGGYVLGGPSTHRLLVARLARACDGQGLTVDYRLGPEHPYPAALDDAVSAYRWLLETGVAPAKIVIAGDSAGGGLTAATLVALRDAGVTLPAAAVCISPWTDLTLTAPSMTSKAASDPMVSRETLAPMAEAYLGGTDPATPLVSPVFAELAGLPPLLIHVGGREVLLDDATRLAERARAAGVEVTLEQWDEMIHVWHAFSPIITEADDAVAKIGTFVRGHWS